MSSIIISVTVQAILVFKTSFLTFYLMYTLLKYMYIYITFLIYIKILYRWQGFTVTIRTSVTSLIRPGLLSSCTQVANKVQQIFYCVMKKTLIIYDIHLKATNISLIPMSISTVNRTQNISLIFDYLLIWVMFKVLLNKILRLSGKISPFYYHSCPFNPLFVSEKQKTYKFLVPLTSAVYHSFMVQFSALPLKTLCIPMTCPRCGFTSVFDIIVNWHRSGHWY